MNDDGWLARGPMGPLVDGLVEGAVRRYRIERPAAEAVIKEALAGRDDLKQVAGGDRSPEGVKRSGAFRRAAAAARRRVYYHLRRYERGGADLQSLVARLGECGPGTSAEERQAAALAVAEAHKSTAERLPSLAEFHRQLFACACDVRTLLDVGCGVYPVLFPFDGAGGSVARYVAADKNPLAVAAVEAYARARGDGRLVALAWDIRDGWEAILEHNGGREFDAALLLKLVPVVHRQRRELLPVLARTPARTWVVTGSRTSMTRRRSIERRERAILRRFVESAGRSVRAEFVAGEEFAWVVE